MILLARKKPMIVETVQYTGSEENIEFINYWSGGQCFHCPVTLDLKVQCLEALAYTPVGSYVVKGVKGEVWPVREDIFNETYEIINQGEKK